MIADRAQLVTDLTVLGVAYGRKLDEADLAVYAALIARELDDAEWAHAFRRHTSADVEDPRWMPTPMQLIAIGLEARRPVHTPPRTLSAEEREWREQYFAQCERQRGLGPGSRGHAELLRGMPAASEPTLSEDAWAERVETLREQAAQILEGK